MCVESVIKSVYLPLSLQRTVFCCKTIKMIDASTVSGEYWSLRNGCHLLPFYVATNILK